MAIRSSERKPAEIPPLLLVALDIRGALIEALARVRALENFILSNLTRDQHVQLDKVLAAEDGNGHVPLPEELKANARRALAMTPAQAKSLAFESGVVARPDQQTALVKKAGRQRARAGRRRAQG